MKTKEEILKESTKTTLNIIEGSPLHDAVMKAMEEYAKQKVENLGLVENAGELYEFVLVNNNGKTIKSTIPCNDWLQADRVKQELMKSNNIVKVYFNKV